MDQRLSPLDSLARLARGRLRARAAALAGLKLLAPAGVLSAGVALSFEVARGLAPADLLLVFAPLALPGAAAVRALRRAVSDEAALKALDDAAGLHDRIGTARALAGAPGDLVERQRADALDHAALVDPRRVLVVAPPERVRPAAGSLLGALLVLLACASFVLTPRRDGAGEAPDAALEAAAEDLLGRLDAIERIRPDLGGKGVSSALTDLRDQVRRIRDQEKAVRKRPRPGPAAAARAPEPAFAAEAPGPEPAVTAEQLEALHQRLQRDLAQAFDPTSASVRDAMARALEGGQGEQMDQLADRMETVQGDHARNMPSLARQGSLANQSVLGGRNGLAPGAQRALGGGGGLGMASPPGMAGAGPSMAKGTQAASSQLRDVPLRGADPSQLEILDKTQEMANSQLDAVKQEFSKGKGAWQGHEQSHNLQESFQHFLDQFTFERSKDVADFLVGKDDGRRRPKPKVTPEDAPGKPMEDRRVSGFEEKRSEDAPPPAGSTQPWKEGKAAAPMPDGVLAEGAGPPQAAAPGAEAADGQGTAKGGEGAGRGDGSEAAGGEADGVVHAPGGESELERILGRTSVSEGGLSPDQRREVFDRVATHKVQGGLNVDDAEPLLGGYFEEADRLLGEAGEELPPLFRAYARGYFASLKGTAAGRDAPTRNSED